MVVEMLEYKAARHHRTFTKIGRFEPTVRAEALSRTASQDLIRKRAGSYGTDQRLLA
jgi:hypothetical protein